MGCKIKQVCSGGVTHFALAPDEEEGGIMTIAWGQNAANGELGLGPEEPKSATKPTRNQPLIGIDVFEFVLFLPLLVRGSLVSSMHAQRRRGPEHRVLPRHPEREVFRSAAPSRRTRHAGRVPRMPQRSRRPARVRQGSFFFYPPRPPPALVSRTHPYSCAVR